MTSRRCLSCRTVAGLSAVVVSLLACSRLPAAAPASAPASAPTTTSAPASQPAVLAPDSFRVFDRPSDDGSEVFITWPKPADLPKGVKFVYVIEIAKSPAGFESGDFESMEVAPSPRALASSNAQYFGHSDKNRKLFYAEFSPADKFTPEPPPVDANRVEKAAAEGLIPAETATRGKALLAASDKWPKGYKPTKAEEAEQEWFAGVTDYLQKQDRLSDLVTKGIISKEAKDRARAALIVTQKPEGAQRTEAEKKDQEWLQRFTAYIGMQNQKLQKDLQQEVNARTYYYRLAVKQDGRLTYVSRDGKPLVLSAAAEPNWFKWTWINNLVLAVFLCGAVFVFIQLAKRRPNLFIRKIAGLEAVEEAIGRSTEMDRPVFFVHGGVSDMGDVATIASVNILARVAQRTAEHDSRVRVMNNDPIVTAVCQEVVQQAYKEAGRPDAFNPDDVSLVASDQFSYVAAVSGNMVREQPGAIFLLGNFYAESLLLAETGASTGAIQVAGTDQYAQLPFFITTCDYTLIGEELYAASAYLSREPRMLGSLRGQDVGKALLMIVMVVVSLTLTAAVWVSSGGQAAPFAWLRDLFRAATGG